MRIFYFSGTGNAKKVAEWMNKHANEEGVHSELVDISKMDIRKVQPEPGEMIGIISPTHGFNYPPIVINFIFRFPRAKYRNKIFLMNTRAGMKLSKLFLPGLSGIAILLASLVLLLKGYRIVGMRPIDLPSNWISLHPGLKEKVIVSMHEHYHKKAVCFIDQMIHGKRNYHSLLGLPWDLAISPIAFGYYFIGRFVLAKTFYASHACDNCMLCIKQCPVKAISLVDNRPFWSYRCESCMRCMNNCPKRAIETAHGFLTVVLILLYTVIISFIYAEFLSFTKYDITGDTSLNSLIRMTFESVLTVFFLIISYRLVHYLRRFKLFEWIIVYTSFTKFRFWRRYRAPK
jgi:ferredoxin